MLTYLSMAEHFKAKWILWENVTGVLSSNRGADFAALLQGLAECGYGFAYRVLDAQHFGVPQRRRRVFVVGCLGDWRSAAKVLFESESLCRDITPSREKGKDVANCLTKSPSSYASFNPARGEGNAVICADLAPTITSSGAGWSRTGNAATEPDTYVAFKSYGDSNVPIALAENTIGRQPLNGGNGNGFTEGGPMYTLNATGVHGIACDTEIAHCLRSGASKADKPDSTTYITAHAFKVRGGCEGGGKGYLGNDNTAFTLSTTQDQQLFSNMRVRRLTPIECERLQGFPDNYTNTTTSSDSSRYKALGNSMAVPVMRWIGQRIKEVENEILTSR